MRATTRLTYGSSPHQWAEFRRPDVDGPVPLVVHFHGGFWRAEYALDHARPFCAGLRRAGYATLNVEYRRVGNDGGGWPGTLTDARGALDLVPRLVDEHRVDAGRVVLTGHSAGGHLALLAAGRTDVGLAGVVPIGALSDLRDAHARHLSDGGTAALDLVGGEPDEFPDRWDEASPIAGVPLPMPVVLVHGRHDDSVPIAQAEAYAAAATEAGGDARVVPVDADHFDVLDADGITFSHVLEVVGALVGGSPDGAGGTSR